MGKKGWRIAGTGLFSVLGVISLLPLFSAGIRNIGVVMPLSIAVAGILFCLTFQPKRKEHRRMAWIFLAVAVAVAILGAVISVHMITAVNCAPAGENETVVVLGCKINGTRPSRMLNDRIRIAVDYLTAHPEAPCVVTGGKGTDEPISEAQAMKNALLEAGISEERIFTEEKSANTEENLRFTVDVIRENGLPESVVIATQEFHQYRASVMAKRAGLSSVSAITCRTPWHLFLCYWVRECAAVCRTWIL